VRLDARLFKSLFWLQRQFQVYQVGISWGARDISTLVSTYCRYFAKRCRCITERSERGIGDTRVFVTGFATADSVRRSRACYVNVHVHVQTSTTRLQMYTSGDRGGGPKISVDAGGIHCGWYRSDHVDDVDDLVTFQVVHLLLISQTVLL